MIRVWDTEFRNPILLAAGTAGFGREIAGVVNLSRIGGLITKAVSPTPRQGNAAPRVAEFSGGMINSVGLANPGVEVVAREMLPWLSAHLGGTRVIVNVVGSVVEDYAYVVRSLRDHEIITAFELNVSCPNTERGGEEFGADSTVLANLVEGCVDETDKPILVKLAPTLEDMAGTASVAAESGARGISVVNTVPGMVLTIDPAGTSRPRLGAGRGGVSGPGLVPIGVLATRQVKEATGLPVIGMGGVRTERDVAQYLEAGASLVAVGTAFLADPRCPERIVRRMRGVGSGRKR